MRTALLGTMLVLLATTAACAKPRSDVPMPSSTPAAVAAPSRASSEPVGAGAGAAATEESVYLLRPRLVGQDGRALALDAYRGHPVVVTMFYGSCPYACPLLVSDIRALLDALPAATRADAHVLLVSFDAARDTPDALKRLAEKRGLDPAHWHLAAAPDADARELAAVLGVRFRAAADGSFEHSSVITVLDAAGAPIAQRDGSDPPVEQLAARVGERLAMGTAGR